MAITEGQPGKVAGVKDVAAREKAMLANEELVQTKAAGEDTHWKKGEKFQEAWEDNMRPKHISERAHHRCGRKEHMLKDCPLESNC